MRRLFLESDHDRVSGARKIEGRPRVMPHKLNWGVRGGGPFCKVRSPNDLRARVEKKVMEESGFSSPPLYSHNVTTHPMRASTFLIHNQLPRLPQRLLLVAKINLFFFFFFLAYGVRR